MGWKCPLLTLHPCLRAVLEPTCCPSCNPWWRGPRSPPRDLPSGWRPDHPFAPHHSMLAQKAARGRSSAAPGCAAHTDRNALESGHPLLPGSSLWAEQSMRVWNCISKRIPVSCIYQTLDTVILSGSSTALSHLPCNSQNHGQGLQRKRYFCSLFRQSPLHSRLCHLLFYISTISCGNFCELWVQNLTLQSRYAFASGAHLSLFINLTFLGPCRHLV